LDLASLWSLDRSVLYLNHGSFGACPTAVLDAQAQLRLEMEREPVDFLVSQLPERLHRTRAVLADFLQANPRDLVFIPNATTGVNAVLQSLPFQRGDEILLTDHTYAACRKAVEFVAQRTGARVVIVQLPFPLRSDAEITTAILDGVSARTRLAVLDHVTSPTALVMPLASLVDELRQRSVETLIDGAHAPGMVPIRLTQLGAAYYTGNAHKWLCAPKGAAFLHARADCQAALHPGSISHGYLQGFQSEFDWTGTFDPTAWLCIANSLRYLQGLLPGGWPEVMASNHGLAVQARLKLLEAFGVDPPCPDHMLGAMASLPLPPGAAGSAVQRLDAAPLRDWFRSRQVEIAVYSQPTKLLRFSAQLYNHLGQFEQLRELLQEALSVQKH
jgi:isopenicillin-N epimerase